MKTKKLTLEVIKIHCRGKTLEKLKLNDFAYGEWLLETEDGLDYAYIDCLNDPGFQEISGMVKNALSGKTDMIRQDGLASVLGLFYDPVNNKPLYAKQNFSSFGGFTEKDCTVTESNPPETKEMEIPYATHLEWSGKSKEEKEELVRQKLTEAGYL